MDYRSQAEQAKKNAELELERARLLERLAEIEANLGGKVTVTAATPTKTVAPKAATTDSPKRRGRPPKNPNAVAAPKEKRIELPSLLETIIRSNDKPMKHKELVVAALNAGYKSDAKDFPNMVYQCLVKLVKKGTLNKVNEGKNAEYTFRGA